MNELTNVPPVGSSIEEYTRYLAQRADAAAQAGYDIRRRKADHGWQMYLIGCTLHNAKESGLADRQTVTTLCKAAGNLSHDYGQKLARVGSLIQPTSAIGKSVSQLIAWVDEKYRKARKDVRLALRAPLVEKECLNANAMESDASDEKPSATSDDSPPPAQPDLMNPDLDVVGPHNVGVQIASLEAMTEEASKWPCRYEPAVDDIHRDELKQLESLCRHLVRLCDSHADLAVQAQKKCGHGMESAA